MSCAPFSEPTGNGLSFAGFQKGHVLDRASFSPGGATAFEAFVCRATIASYQTWARRCESLYPQKLYLWISISKIINRGIIRSGTG